MEKKRFGMQLWWVWQALPSPAFDDPAGIDTLQSASLKKLSETA